MSVQCQVFTSILERTILNHFRKGDGTGIRVLQGPAGQWLQDHAAEMTHVMIAHALCKVICQLPARPTLNTMRMHHDTWFATPDKANQVAIWLTLAQSC